MLKWILVALIVTAVAWYGLNAVGSSMALADFGGRPITGFVGPDDIAVSVQNPGQPAAEGTARPRGGVGIPFGSRYGYLLPDSTVIVCTHRFRALSCTEGWTPVREPASP